MPPLNKSRTIDTVASCLEAYLHENGGFQSNFGLVETARLVVGGILERRDLAERQIDLNTQRRLRLRLSTFVLKLTIDKDSKFKIISKASKFASEVAEMLLNGRDMVAETLSEVA